MNNNIGTHNSATGEKGYGILSKIFAPFSVCQSKTIGDQLRAGVSYFDIRVRKTKRGIVCAHGLWETKKTADDILSQINQIARRRNIYVKIMYENAFKYRDEDMGVMISVLNELKDRFKNIKFVGGYIKNPYTIVCGGFKIQTIDAYAPIYKWHKELFLPIPWIWAKIDKWFGGPLYGRADNESIIIKDFV